MRPFGSEGRHFSTAGRERILGSTEIGEKQNVQIDALNENIVRERGESN